jgi:hypothetical protein
MPVGAGYEKNLHTVGNPRVVSVSFATNQGEIAVGFPASDVLAPNVAGKAIAVW